MTEPDLRKLRKYRLRNKEVKLRKVIKPSYVAQYARSLTHNNKDSPIIISGYPGEGKSVLAVKIAKQYDKRFSYDRNLIYSRKELKRKIDDYKPSAFIIDESIDILYKRSWNKSSQREIVRLLNKCRSQGHLLIFVQPQFTDMDKDIRKGRIRLWIYVVKRGVAGVMRPLRQLGGSKDPWNLKDNNKMIKRKQKELNDDFFGMLEGLYESENFLNYMRWTDLYKDEYDAYEEVKDRKKYDEDEDDMFYDKEEAHKLAEKEAFRVLAHVKHYGKLKRGSYKYISSYFDISNSSVSSKINKALIEQGYKEKKKEKGSSSTQNLNKKEAREKQGITI